MSGTPTWRRVFDVVEQRVGDPLTRVTNTSEFLEAMRAAQRLNRSVNRLGASAWSWGLHRWQLPAYGDMRRLSRQLNQIERRLRELSHQVDDLATREDLDGGHLSD